VESAFVVEILLLLSCCPAVRLSIGSIALIFWAVVFANQITKPSQPASVSSEEVRELRMTVEAQTLMIKKLQSLLDKPID